MHSADVRYFSLFQEGLSKKYLKSSIQKRLKETQKQKRISRFRYSYICQGTLTSRKRIDLFSLWIKLPSVITSLTTQK